MSEQKKINVLEAVRENTMVVVQLGFTPLTSVPQTIESQRIWMMDRNYWSHSCQCRRCQSSHRFWVMLRTVLTADQAAAAI